MVAAGPVSLGEEQGPPGKGPPRRRRRCEAVCSAQWVPLPRGPRDLGGPLPPKAPGTGRAARRSREGLCDVVPSRAVAAGDQKQATAG